MNVRPCIDCGADTSASMIVYHSVEKPWDRALGIKVPCCRSCFCKRFTQHALAESPPEAYVPRLKHPVECKPYGGLSEKEVRP